MVAPAVAWLSHESCTINSEIIDAVAGRIARVVVAETKGVFRPDWTIEEVAEQADHFRDTSDLVIFPPTPSGFQDHLGFSFDMARTR